MEPLDFYLFEAVKKVNCTQLRETLSSKSSYMDLTGDLLDITNAFNNTIFYYILKLNEHDQENIYSIIYEEIEQRWPNQTHTSQYSNHSGYTLCHLACLTNRVETIKSMYNNRINIDMVGKNHIRPIHYAIQQLHFELVQFILSTGIELGTSDNGIPLISEAVLTGNIDMVNIILHAIKHMQKSSSPNNDKAQDLINEQNIHTKTSSLATASYHGYFSIVEALIDNDANVNTDTGISPLHCAAARGHIEVVLLLLANGANPDYRCDDDLAESLLPDNIYAAFSNGATAYEVAENSEIKEILLKAMQNSSTVNDEDTNMNTPLCQGH